MIVEKMKSLDEINKSVMCLYVGNVVEFIRYCALPPSQDIYYVSSEKNNYKDFFTYL